MTSVLGLLGIATLALACSKSTPPATPTPPAAKALPASEPSATATQTTAAKHVVVDDSLAAQCKFELEKEAPKFSLDEFELDPTDRQLLDQLATCMLQGPLRGKAVSLTGHADPRGTDEYNLGLGDRRAGRVRDYLIRLGVAPTQLSATTRGELDARGNDEPTWSDDRRVEIRLL